MSGLYTTDVECDQPGCLQWTHGPTKGRSVSLQDARREARARGWTTQRTGGKVLDFCPRHR